MLRICSSAERTLLQVDKRKLDRALTFPQWKPREHPRLTMPLQQKRLRKRRRWAGNRWSNMRSIFSVIRDGEVLVQVLYFFCIWLLYELQLLEHVHFMCADAGCMQHCSVRAEDY